MPCFEAGVPVMIDMLFGQVKLGTVPSATTLKPSRMKRAMFGIQSSRRHVCRYAGSPPSMHTPAPGRWAQRQAPPLTFTTGGSLAVAMSASAILIALAGAQRLGALPPGTGRDAGRGPRHRGPHAGH